MLLDALRDFEWLNEPPEISFMERGVRMTSSPHTDFWQDKSIGYNKDDGHFFYGCREGAFSMTAHWRCGIPSHFAQCGLMGRINEHYWFKISLFSKNGSVMNIGSVVTNDGNSDLALVPISGCNQEIWFRFKRDEQGVIELSYSLNDIVYIAVRRFRLNCDINNLESGVFICSPANVPYTAVLMSISFSS